MYEQIIENLNRQLSIEELKKITESPVHLGIFTEPYLTYMLEGKKTIESRFSKNKSLPIEKFAKGDTVIVKKSSGPIMAYFTVKEALFFDLQETLISTIKEKYGQKLCVNEDFWVLKNDSRYATLLIIENIKKLEPFTITKKGMQTWITFRKETT